MTHQRVTSTFGRIPSHRSPAPLGAPDTETPAAPVEVVDPCSPKAWYQDHAPDERGPAMSVLATLVGATAVGAAGGAAAWKKHRVVGGLLGAVGGWVAGYGVSAFRFGSWKSAGGASHVAGACATPAAAPGGSPPEKY